MIVNIFTEGGRAFAAERSSREAPSQPANHSGPDSFASARRTFNHPDQLQHLYLTTQLHSFTTATTRPRHQTALSLTMPPLTSTSSTLLRTCTRQSLPSVRASTSALQQRRGRADVNNNITNDYRPNSSFESPFNNADTSETTKVPSFKNYLSHRGQTGNKVFQYFMVGSMGLLTAAGAKATVTGT